MLNHLLSLKENRNQKFQLKDHDLNQNQNQKFKLKGQGLNQNRFLNRDPNRVTNLIQKKN